MNRKDVLNAEKPEGSRKDITADLTAETEALGDKKGELDAPLLILRGTAF